MKTCSRCGETKSLSDFNKKREKHGSSGVQPYCRPCQQEKAREYYHENPDKHLPGIAASRARRRKKAEKYLIEYFAEHPCVDCGETDICCLDFDHVVDAKEFNISYALHGGYSLETIRNEIAKCEVRCRNCHAKLTHEHNNSWRWKATHGNVRVRMHGM